MTDMCFSAWMGRPNPAPNLGFADVDDLCALMSKLNMAPHDRLTPRELRTLGALHRVYGAHQTPDAASGRWDQFADCVAAHLGLSPSALTPSLQFYDRLYD